MTPQVIRMSALVHQPEDEETLGLQLVVNHVRKWSAFPAGEALGTDVIPTQTTNDDSQVFFDFEMESLRKAG